MNPFESLGYGMMRAFLEAQRTIAPAKKKSRKRVARLPIEPTNPLGDEEEPQEQAGPTVGEQIVNDIEAAVMRRQRRREREQHEPTEAEIAEVRRSQEYNQGERDDREAEHLVDGTFLNG